MSTMRRRNGELRNLSTEKIGVTQLAEVKTTGRRHYIRLDPKVVLSYDLKIGDLLKVEILEVRRKAKTE